VCANQGWLGKSPLTVPSQDGGDDGFDDADGEKNHDVDDRKYNDDDDDDSAADGSKKDYGGKDDDAGSRKR
jgi:hypothetical protein